MHSHAGTLGFSQWIKSYLKPCLHRTHFLFNDYSVSIFPIKHCSGSKALWCSPVKVLTQVPPGVAAVGLLIQPDWGWKYCGHLESVLNAMLFFYITSNIKWGSDIFEDIFLWYNCEINLSIFNCLYKSIRANLRNKTGLKMNLLSFTLFLPVVLSQRWESIAQPDRPAGGTVIRVQHR